MWVKQMKTELIYDVHASESGALAILDDLYEQINAENKKDTKYIFVVSTPEYKSTDSITVIRYPWVKRSWLHRLYFDVVTTREILKHYRPDSVYSLQNEGISFYKGPQKVYLHLPFVLCDYRFDIRRDGKRLWLYQNILSRRIFSSLRKVDKVIVQTQWMKDALVKKANVKPENITVKAPDISLNIKGQFIDTEENRKRFFYPATAFTYKNHMVLLEALNLAVHNGLKDYEVIFTIRKDENSYTESLCKYAEEHKLNIDFHGTMTRERVFDMYTKSVLVFPSFVESFGLPLLEARESGTYILASNCPFSREILSDYDKVRFFEPHDEGKLAKLITGEL